MGEEDGNTTPQKANAPTREQLLTYIKCQKVKIAELEETLSAAKALQQRKNEESKVRLETLEFTLNESVKELEEEKCKFLSQETSFKKYNEEAKAQRNQIDELMSELIILRQNKEETKEIVVRLEKRFEESRDDVTVQRKENSELTNQLKTESVSKAEPASKLETALIAVEEKKERESQLLEIISKNDGLTIQLKTMQKDKEDLESLLAAASESDVRENGVRVKELSEVNNDLVEQLEESHRTMDRLTKQMNERCESTERKFESSRRQLEEVQKEKDAALLKWKGESAFEAKHKVLLREAEQLRLQVEQARQDREMDVVASETGSLDVVKQTHDDGDVDSEMKISKRENEEGLLSQLRALKNENAVLRSDFDARDSEIRQCSMHVEELELKLRNDIELAQQESLDLKEEVERQCKERHDLLNERGNLKKEANEQLAISQEANEALMRLKCDKDALQEQLDAAVKINDGHQECSTQPLEETQAVSEMRNAELETQLHLLEERLKISDDRYNTVLGNNEVNLSQVDKLKQQLRECETSLLEATKMHENLQHDRDSLQQQLQSVVKEGEEGTKSLDAQVIESNTQLEAVTKSLSASEGRCAMLLTEKEAKCTELERLEGKMKRLKVLLTKSQRALANKDEQLKKTQAPQENPPPSSVIMHLRVRFEGRNSSGDDDSIWCLLEPTTTVNEVGEENGRVGGGETDRPPRINDGRNPEVAKESSWLWRRQTKVLEWLRVGSTHIETPEAEWPAPVQDGAREVQAALESEIAHQTNALESIQDEFSKYKKRAQAALKKPMNSKILAQANEIMELQAALDAMSEDNKQLNVLLEQQKLDSENDVGRVRLQLDEVQSEKMEMKAHIDKQASVITGHEARCSHLEDELRSTEADMTAARNVETTLRASESCLQNSIREKDELITSLREELQLAKTVAIRETTPASPPQIHSYLNLTDNNGIMKDWQQQSSTELPISTYNDSASESASAIEDSGDSGALPPRLLAFDARRDRNRTEKFRDAAAISQLQLEVMDTSNQLELLSSQNLMLKETIRGLDAGIAREHTLNSGIDAELNTEYLKAVVFRYMASPDTTEKKQLLSVIGEILKLTREETVQVEQRIHEMESGGLRRMSGVIGGTVGAVGGVVGGVAGGARGVWNYVKGGNPLSSASTAPVLPSTGRGGNGDSQELESHVAGGNL